MTRFMRSGGCLLLNRVSARSCSFLARLNILNAILTCQLETAQGYARAFDPALPWR